MTGCIQIFPNPESVLFSPFRTDALAVSSPSPLGDGQRNYSCELPTYSAARRRLRAEEKTATHSVSAPAVSAPHLHGRSELPVRMLAPAQKAISSTQTDQFWKSERPVRRPAVDPSGLSHHRGTAR